MALRKNLITIELFHQPNMHVVIAFVHHSLWCEFASTFNVLTRFGLERLMLQDVLRRVSGTLGLRFPILNFAVGVDGNPQPCCFRFWIEVIVFTLFYTCDLPLL